MVSTSYTHDYLVITIGDPFTVIGGNQQRIMQLGNNYNGVKNSHQCPLWNNHIIYIIAAAV